MKACEIHCEKGLHVRLSLAVALSSIQTGRIFKADSVKSIPRIHGWRTKTCDWANCKGQLALTVRGERGPRRIVRSQRSQTLAQITIQLNDGAIRTVSKRTVQSSLHCMGFGSLRPTRVPLFNARHRVTRLAWVREQRGWSVEDWKRVSWNEES
ncbi:HTH_Tnp_Tc3_2 domain-containing protein [Trichonephila clavipes]|nr:HTH_Tnp_Tc3_2 domain-containing protein [Trichonephila clavipes]